MLMNVHFGSRFKVKFKQGACQVEEYLDLNNSVITALATGQNADVGRHLAAGSRRGTDSCETKNVLGMSGPTLVEFLCKDELDSQVLQEIDQFSRQHPDLGRACISKIGSTPILTQDSFSQEKYKLQNFFFDLSRLQQLGLSHSKVEDLLDDM